jgi:hypothetical protein
MTRADMTHGSVCTHSIHKNGWLPKSTALEVSSHYINMINVSDLSNIELSLFSIARNTHGVKNHILLFFPGLHVFNLWLFFPVLLTVFYTEKSSLYSTGFEHTRWIKNHKDGIANMTICAFTGNQIHQWEHRSLTHKLYCVTKYKQKRVDWTK